MISIIRDLLKEGGLCGKGGIDKDLLQLLRQGHDPVLHLFG